MLNELHAALQHRDVRTWRDKNGHEVDFVLVPRGLPPIAIECKWSAGDVSLRGLAAFRRRYPEGPSFVVCHDAIPPFSRDLDGHEVRFVDARELVRAVQAP